MPRTLIVVVLVGCVLAGCVMGGGPVVGYGKKRGFYAGAAGYAGASMAHATLEVGGNRDGAVVQARLDLEASRLRLLHGPDENELTPGIHAGIGYAGGQGAGGMTAVVGPDVGLVRERSNCTGTQIYYVGLDWRYVAGESLFALAPRYEQLSDICLR